MKKPSKAEMAKVMGWLGTKGGAIGGLSRSPAKKRAARENGKLGGRPPKAAPFPRD